MKDRKLLDKRKRRKSKFRATNLVGTADLKEKTFSKSDATNWNYKLYKFTEIGNDTITCYKNNIFQNVIFKLYSKK